MKTGRDVARYRLERGFTTKTPIAVQMGCTRQNLNQTEKQPFVRETWWARYVDAVDRAVEHREEEKRRMIAALNETAQGADL